jgi:cell division protein FtsA
MNTNKDANKTIIALDIGTTKVCAIAGRKNDYGKIEILGLGKVESEGVLRGVVSNIDKTVKAISNAVEICSRQYGGDFQNVYVGIAGQHIKSLQNRGIVTREQGDMEISSADLERLKSDMYKIALPPGYKILHVIPQEYTVDSEQGIVDPVGMHGNVLEANFHIITGQITAANNIIKCVERADLSVADMTLEPIASASSVLSDEEMEAGVALVDIGGGTTDITVFHEGIIRHTAVIPFGGNVITKDIKEGCTVMNDQAEKLKVKFGCALADEIRDNRIITVPTLRGREAKEISEVNLAKIIEARLEEILDYVYWEIRRSGYERGLLGGIVLTGGGSLLKSIDKLTEFHTGMNTRIGFPIERLAQGYTEKVSSPIFSTAIGLLINGIKHSELNPELESVQKISFPKPKNERKDPPEPPEDFTEEPKNDELLAGKKPERKWVGKLFEITKNFFEPTPDIDL